MSTLFDQTVINGMQLKNRIVRSATHEGMADVKGFPTDALLNLYDRLARGGVGLIITGYAFVSQNGRSDARGMLGIDSDDHVAAYRRLTDHVHRSGACIALQIAHAGRQTSSRIIGSQPIAPSPVSYRPTGETPRQMNETDIGRIVDAFGKAARRARDAGFDALQLHAAHGYLLSAFLCPYTNRRNDRWGGSVENRMRIVKEIYERCRREAGFDFPLLIKINSRDSMRRGLRLDEALTMAAMLDEIGFDGVEVSCGIGDDGFSAVRGDFPVDLLLDDLKMMHGNPVMRFLFRKFGKKMLRVPPFTENYNLDAAKVIKKKVSIPVFTVGGISDPALMHDSVSRGEVDYISLCRPLIINPGWPNEIRDGSLELSRCIRCNYCLYYSLLHPVKCYYGKRVHSST